MILYVHPKTDLFLRELVPMSVPALMNRLPRPVHGRFHNEWTRDEVREARPILLDVHCHLSPGTRSVRCARTHEGPQGRREADRRFFHAAPQSVTSASRVCYRVPPRGAGRAPE